MFINTNCVYFGFSYASVTTRKDSSLISAACSLATYFARVNHHALLGRHKISAEVSVTRSYLLTFKLDKPALQFVCCGYSIVCVSSVRTETVNVAIQVAKILE